MIFGKQRARCGEARKTGDAWAGGSRECAVVRDLPGAALEKVCPNEAARHDTTFSPPVGEREGPVCLYSDPRCPDVVCRGRGHFARHHVQVIGVESRDGGIALRSCCKRRGGGSAEDEEWFGPGVRWGVRAEEDQQWLLDARCESPVA